MQQMPVPAAGGIVSASGRLVAARERRAQTDYLFSFWTAFGWTVLTFGIYGFYVWYKLTERMREHNRRRLQFLEAANELSWQHAGEQGRQDEMRSRFERVGADLSVLRQMTTDFRDPGIWLLLLLVGSTVAAMVLHYLLDVDLVKHREAEADAEATLNGILTDLGMGSGLLPHPAPAKAPHNYAGRIVASITSCGLYLYWWLADLMREGNEHFQRDWAWEDAVVPVLWRP